MRKPTTVTDEQYEAARDIAAESCWSSFYEEQGADPAVYGHPRPDAERVTWDNGVIQRYHTAHPGGGLTREELLAEFAARGWAP